MTKFKELRRIERAIENQDEPELRWALNYCDFRLQIATLKTHKKTWSKIRGNVEKSLVASSGGT